MTKRGRKAQQVKPKALSREKARQVKGGVIAIIAPADPSKQTELLPYIEQSAFKGGKR